MHYQYLERPDWWLKCSPETAAAKCAKTPHHAVYAHGDSHFNPPKEGMLVFDHAKPEVRSFWLATCFRAVETGLVDGCFSDSSEVGSHGTTKFLNESYNNAYEAGKVLTMATATARFGGAAGQAYPRDATGVLIGKKPDQQGINALQIEFFEPSQAGIQELMQGVDKGYLVQAHAGVNSPASTQGCPAMRDSVAAFLIGAGENSYYGSGAWMSPSLADVQQRWCPELFEKPLGPPMGPAVLDSNGTYSRTFKSGTLVSFDTKTNVGKIVWGRGRGW